MPPLRSLIPFLTYFVLVSCLLFLSSETDSNDSANSRHPNSSHNPLKSLFSFHGPGALFAPAAIISLTDDNSTFFNARPAAFGPRLPSHGLSGPVWTGRTIPSDEVGEVGSIYAEGGELGCSDIPGWDSENWPLHQERKGAGGLRRASTMNLRVGPPGSRYLDMPHTTTSDEEKLPSDTPHRAEKFIKQSTVTQFDGKIALLARGGCGFLEKVLWAQKRGSTAVIIGDNLPGGPLVTMYAKGDTSNVTIPSIFTSHMTAHLLSSLVPEASDNNVLRSRSELDASSFSANRFGMSEFHEGLWVTLSITNLGTNPFFNTLFVLVVSPLITLAIVYIMLLVRARIRRRRWRAPKSVVDRLPVRVYHAISSRASPRATPASSPPSPTARTPLLIHDHRNEFDAPGQHSEPSPTSQASIPTSSYGSLSINQSEEKRTPQDIPQAKRKYNQRQVECSVCLEEYEDGVSRVMSLPCGHDFHVECVTPWLTTKRRTCPICKGDVVRSLGESEGALPSRAASQASSRIGVQTQGTETTNHSPSMAGPSTVHHDEVQDITIRRDIYDRHGNDEV